MKALFLLGNTRVKSNTEQLTKELASELKAKGFDITMSSLREKDIQTCVGCYVCHSVLDSFGCVIKDDVQEIALQILESDLVILSSPIYSWMPTPPLKAVMDRMYAFTKYPKDKDDFNLMNKQVFAMVATAGDVCEKNCDLFDESVRRMAKFAKLPYVGYLAAQDHSDGEIIKPAVLEDVKVFAQKCLDAVK